MQSVGSKIARALLGREENKIEDMLVAELNLFNSSPLSYFYAFSLLILCINFDILAITSAYLKVYTKKITYL